MTRERISDFVVKTTGEITELRESIKSAHKRLDDTDDLITQVHKLAISVETLAFQIKNQNDNMLMLFNSVESRLKSQGERISRKQKTA